MTPDVILRRLNLIKNLFKQGLRQGAEPETIAYTAVLSMHDAIDMFMNLAAEKVGLKKGGFMMQYFTDIPQLTLGASVNKLNKRRNALKHDGLIPAKVEIDDSCSVATAFFEANTQIIFGLDFTTVSWLQMITYKEPREFLENSEQSLAAKKYEEAAHEIAKAFFHLLHINESVNKYSKSSPFSTAEPPLFEEGKFYVKGVEPFFEGMEQTMTEPKKPNGFVEVSEGVAALAYLYNRTFIHLYDMVSILTLGLDTKKYNYFRSFMPAVYRFSTQTKKYSFMAPPGYNAANLTEEKIVFAIDFVAEFALNLQQNYTAL